MRPEAELLENPHPLLPPEAGATDLKRQRHLLEEADLILVMTDEQRRMLASFPEATGKPVLTVRELAGEEQQHRFFLCKSRLICYSMRLFSFSEQP